MRQHDLKLMKWLPFCLVSLPHVIATHTKSFNSSNLRATVLNVRGRIRNNMLEPCYISRNLSWILSSIDGIHSSMHICSLSLIHPVYFVLLSCYRQVFDRWPRLPRGWCDQPRLPKPDFFSCQFQNQNTTQHNTTHSTSITTPTRMSHLQKIIADQMKSQARRLAKAELDSEVKSILEESNRQAQDWADSKQDTSYFRLTRGEICVFPLDHNVYFLMRHCFKPKILPNRSRTDSIPLGRREALAKDHEAERQALESYIERNKVMNVP